MIYRTLEPSPTREEMEFRRRPFDLSLGIFTAVAVVLLFWGFCWLKNYPLFHRLQHVNVVFSEIAGLNDSAAVYVDGVRVGMVESIEWRKHHEVLVRLRINCSKILIREGSKFEILTNGIVGARYIEITPPDPTDPDLQPEPIKEAELVHGEDPVRPELAVNKLALTLSSIDVAQLQKNLSADRKRLIKAADQLAVLADKSMPVIDRTLPLENQLISLTSELRTTTKHLNKVLDNPKLGADLKETAANARATAAHLQSSISQLKEMLSDTPLRQDLMKSFSQLNESTLSIERSLKSVSNLAEDKELRNDLTQITRNTNESLARVNEMLKDPNGTDLKSTLQSAKSAINNLDTVGKQLNQILDKRYPLFHMMFGRPGKVDKKQEKQVKKMQAEHSQQKKLLNRIEQKLLNRKEDKVSPSLPVDSVPITEPASAITPAAPTPTAPGPAAPASAHE